MVGEILEKFKIPIGLSLVGLVLIIGGMFASNLGDTKPQVFPKESLVDSQKIISVDVSGAVNRPGVYQLKFGARVEDAIKFSGGFANIANKEYISKYLNMAQKLSDGSKIYVPFEGESSSAVSVTQGGVVSGASTQNKININSSTQAELESLPGIGPVTASKIISGRPYQNTEELSSKKIVSKAVYEKIKDSVVIY